ncbi:MAG: hypothetical protein FWD53_10670 [Phycisphaerales bacterium]|nr:hypothetical protein [Phycisphaerales bacterium]
MSRAVLLTCLLAACLFPSCGRSLFKDARSGTDRRIDVYYEGESAVRTRESRQRTAEMGFGYPTGP